MTHAVTLLAAARDDLAEAMNWYRNVQLGLDADLLLCVEEVIDRIARNPHYYQRVHGEFRRTIVHRFPYAVLYCVAPGHIIVAGILHTSRSPRIWQARAH